MINEMQNAFNSNINNKNIRVVLISSSCNVFCSGADLKYLEQIVNFNYEEHLEDSKKLMSLFKTMLTYPKIIISKVSGAAIAGGCGIMTASDIIFATDESRFGYPEVKIGFIPALVSTILISKINETKTRELLLTGKIINAKEAYKIGLIHYLYHEDDINNEILKFIQHFTKTTSSKSIQRTKKIMYDTLQLDNKLNKAAEFNAKSRMEDDFKKGVNAFLKKEIINWNNNI